MLLNLLTKTLSKFRQIFFRALSRFLSELFQYFFFKIPTEAFSVFYQKCSLSRGRKCILILAKLSFKIQRLFWVNSSSKWWKIIFKKYHPDSQQIFFQEFSHLFLTANLFKCHQEYSLNFDRISIQFRYEFSMISSSSSHWIPVGCLLCYCIADSSKNFIDLPRIFSKCRISVIPVRKE